MFRLALLVTFAACSSKSPAKNGAPADLDLGTSRAIPVSDATSLDAAIEVDAAPTPPPPPSPTAGVDFIDDAKLLYRIAACGNLDQPVDAALTKIVDAHCKRIMEPMTKFRAQYFEK